MTIQISIDSLSEGIALAQVPAPSWTSRPLSPYISASITLLLVIRSYTNSSLTPLGIIAAVLTAVIHASHPSPLPFILLCVFFLLGTTATKIKADAKARLTLSSTGGSVTSTATTHAHPRNATQVLANSGCATILCLLRFALKPVSVPGHRVLPCFNHVDTQSAQLEYLFLVGIIANYAAVTADTLSSELGILSPSPPRLVTTFRQVLPGTNGGVTLIGLVSGLVGAGVIGLISAFSLPICNEASFDRVSLGRGAAGDTGKLKLAGCVALWGVAGSLLDSLLGATLQASVVDRRSGKVVEAADGGHVKVVAKHDVDGGTGKPGREVRTGKDILSNNGVNYTMASLMTIGAMFVVGYLWKTDVAVMRASVRF